MVEGAVRAFVGEDKIAKNLNADEAAVMGAALYGAGITRGFRTKDIRVQDVATYGIDVSYEADRKDEGQLTLSFSSFLTMSQEAHESVAYRIGAPHDQDPPFPRAVQARHDQDDVVQEVFGLLDSLLLHFFLSTFVSPLPSLFAPHQPAQPLTLGLPAHPSNPRRSSPSQSQASKAPSLT